jgi:hypothetical protein
MQFTTNAALVVASSLVSPSCFCDLVPSDVQLRHLVVGPRILLEWRGLHVPSSQSNSKAFI